MIYTTFDRLSRYRGISAPLDTAIDYLLKADLSQLTPGRNEVDGENVYINRFGYTTLPEEEAAWEGHVQYADIHVVLSGEERIGVSDVARLTPTIQDPASAFAGFEGPGDTWFSMAPGTLLIVFPEDVHMVKVQRQGPVQVEKAVVKVLA